MPPAPPAKHQALADKARALPKSPGVYLMKDDKGRVIYVGKARILPNRVATYFQPAADLGPKKQPMIDQIDDFDVVQCEGEWEALLMENRLIKDLHPPFNARLTDDKTFPYLVITMRNDFPGVFITREPTADEFRGAKVLGPFTSVYALRQSMQLLQRVFKYRTCSLEILADDDKRRFFRPCILHSIKRCTAPCAARISPEDYSSDIDRFIRFLDSKRSVMQREMQQEMEAASKAQQYEKAAALRDQLSALEKLDERGKRSQRWQPETEQMPLDPRKSMASLQRALGVDQSLRSLECFDIAHLHGHQTVAAKVTFIDGRPLKNAYRRYRIRTAGNDDFMSMREVISRAYRRAGVGQELYPDVILIDGGAGQLSAAHDALALFDVAPPLVIALAKKEELIYVQGADQPLRLSRRNPGLRLCQAARDEAHRFAQHYHHLIRRKNMTDT